MDSVWLNPIVFVYRLRNPDETFLLDSDRILRPNQRCSAVVLVLLGKVELIKKSFESCPSFPLQAGHLTCAHVLRLQVSSFVAGFSVLQGCCRFFVSLLVSISKFSWFILFADQI